MDQRTSKTFTLQHFFMDLMRKPYHNLSYTIPPLNYIKQSKQSFHFHYTKNSRSLEMKPIATNFKKQKLDMMTKTRRSKELKTCSLREPLEIKTFSDKKHRSDGKSY